MAAEGVPQFESVSCDLRRRVAHIVVTTNRPGNMMGTDTYTDLFNAVRWAASERRARVVVITGRPNFSVGGDWAAHKERDVQSFRDHLALLLDISIKVRTMGRPVIAAVRGRCTGGMNQLAAQADLTIASENAVFGQHGCRTGSFPAFWGTQLLPLIVGEKRAREIVFMSWEYTAQEALSMGLVNRVVPDGQLEAEVERWCERLIEMSPRSLRFAKTAMNYGSDQRWAGVWHGRDALAEFAGTPEWEEAIDSYLEKRPPRWAEDER
jgi:1,4-dihydroxy-2-naphthoyl-CoA synthase